MNAPSKEYALNQYFSETEQYYERIDHLHDAAYYRRYIGLVRPSIREGRFLDIACGTGWVIKHFSDTEGTGHVGVDISPAGLGIASRNSGRAANNRFVAANAKALPFKSNSFAAVGALTFLEHSYTPVENIREMVRVLRPGGRIVLCHTNFLSPFAPLVKTSFTAVIRSVARNLFLWGGWKRFAKVALKLIHKGVAPEFVQPSLDPEQIRDGINYNDAQGVWFPSDPDAVYLVNPVDLVRILQSLKVRIELMTTWAAYKKIFAFINLMPYINVIGPGCTIVGIKETD